MCGLAVSLMSHGARERVAIYPPGSRAAARGRARTTRTTSGCLARKNRSAAVPNEKGRASAIRQGVGPAGASTLTELAPRLHASANDRSSHETGVAVQVRVTRVDGPRALQRCARRTDSRSSPGRASESSSRRFRRIRFVTSTDHPEFSGLESSMNERGGRDSNPRPPA